MLAFSILAIASVTAMLGYLVGIVLAHFFVRPKDRTAPTVFPPLSLLKPLKGSEEELETNLRSFFTQNYPAALEIVFAATDPDDPGIVTARKVAKAYPHIPAKFIVSDATFGLNPKLNDLAAAYDHASHDLVFQSDGNVRIAHDYLKSIVTELETEGASLLSSPVVGTGEQSIGAAIENAHLTAFIAASVCVAEVVTGITCVVGKSMLFRKSEMDPLGGLARFKDMLCEDFLIGERYRQAHKKVILSRFPIANINVRVPVSHFFSRHSRWLKMQAAIHPPSFLLTLFWGNPTVLAFIWALANGFAPAPLAFFACAILVKSVGDIFLIGRLRGKVLAPRHWWVLPFKDLFFALLWPYAAFSRHVRWRGTRLRMGKKSRLIPDSS